MGSSSCMKQLPRQLLFSYKTNQTHSFLKFIFGINSTCFGQIICPKHVEFYSKNKFEKLVRLVGFIIRVYHDARSPERHICPNNINQWQHYITSFVHCPSPDLIKCDYGVWASLIHNAQMAVRTYWTTLSNHKVSGISSLQK